MRIFERQSGNIAIGILHITPKYVCDFFFSVVLFVCFLFMLSYHRIFKIKPTKMESIKQKL